MSGYFFEMHGQPSCPSCGHAIATRTIESLLEEARRFAGKKSYEVAVPMVRGRKGFHKDIFELGAKLGLQGALVDGERVDITPTPSLNRYEEHSLNLLWAKEVPRVLMSRLSRWCGKAYR